MEPCYIYVALITSKLGLIDKSRHFFDGNALDCLAERQERVPLIVSGIDVINVLLLMCDQDRLNGRAKTREALKTRQECIENVTGERP